MLSQDEPEVRLGNPVRSARGEIRHVSGSLPVRRLGVDLGVEFADGSQPGHGGIRSVVGQRELVRIGLRFPCHAEAGSSGRAAAANDVAGG